MNLRKTMFLVAATVMLFSMHAASQPFNINTIGGFEGGLPSYWTMGNQPGGSTLTWATDQSSPSSLGRSLEITKTATSDSASWVSENMVDYWSQRHYANVDMKIGAWVKTQGVNTAPGSNADAQWYVAYTFYDSAGTLIGQTKLPIDQTVATSSGWLADTNGVEATVLPRDSWKTIISFVGGKNATGTVWADNFILVGRGGAWAGQDWDAGVGVPTGWIYYFQPNGGNDGLVSDGYENTRLTTETSHSGLYSLKFNLPFTRPQGDGFVGTKRMLLDSLGADVKAGDVLRISVWIKASNLVPDSAAKYPTTWAVGFTPGFWKGNGNNDGFNNISGYPQDFQFVFPPVTSFDWTQYYLDVTVPSDPTTEALDLRLHTYSMFTGTVYFDDLTVEKLDIPKFSGIGGFESPLPSYWTMGNQPGGSTLTWATDQSSPSSLGRSLEITKTATSDSASWVSENMVDYWSQRHYANVDMKIGAWVKTQGVNTAPGSNADAQWYVAYTFYDSAGTLIGQTKLPIDQTVATSSGWLADTNGVEATVLPRDSWKTIISFVGGKNATGTVWADNFILVGRGGAWAGQDWDAGVGVPTGWIYYFQPNGGNDGLVSDGYENTRLTTETSHSGLYSLKFNLPFTRPQGDGFVGTKRMLLDSLGADVKAGDVLRISVWIKASNLVPDSAAKYPTTWAVGFTPGFWKGNGNNDGFNNISGYPQDFQFVFPPVTSFDWTQYYLDVTVPSDPTTEALDLRLHTYSMFTGTVYFDDLTVQVIGATTSAGDVKDGLPRTFELSDNYPNPFNPSTMINYGVPKNGTVSLIVYNILGQRVRTLVNAPMTAGRYSIAWDGRNEAGSVLSSGVYFYRLQAGATALVKKMLLLK